MFCGKSVGVPLKHGFQWDDMDMARRTKADKVNMRAHILGPSDADKLRSNMELEETISSGGMPGKNAEQRFKELGARIGIAAKIASESPRSKVSMDHPWLHEMAADRMVIELEQRLHLSERVVAEMMREMVSQAAVSEELRALLRIVREHLEQGTPDMPGGLMKFVRRLHASGLLVSSVKDMSNASVMSIAALLNGEMDPEIADAVGLGRSTRYVTMEAAENAVLEAERLRSEYDASVESVSDVEVDLIIEPVVPEGFDGPWDYATGPLPPEYWSTFQELSIPYRWEYRMATPEEEESVAGMILPEAHDWTALRSWDTHFSEITMPRVRTRKGGITNIRDFMAIKLGHEPDNVDMNLVKTWLMLLCGRFLSEYECDVLFEPGFFEGIAMPCPATGPGVIRRLVRKEE